MKKTLTALMVAAGVVGFAGVAVADCSFHTAQISKPTTTSEQSTPVVKPTTTDQTAQN
jgi:cytoskeletal protein RodZ